MDDKDKVRIIVEAAVKSIREVIDSHRRYLRTYEEILSQECLKGVLKPDGQ